MRRAWEQTISKVELKTELDWLKPLEPKEAIDFEINEDEEPITDPMETLKILLKMNWYTRWISQFLKTNKYQVYTGADWKQIFVKDGRIVEDIVEDVVRLKYWGQYAYIKKNDMALYGAVMIRPYKIKILTQYGAVMLPELSVDWTVVYFKWDKCLSGDEIETYRLYNEKKRDFNRLELEKKIMADLITYSQMGAKTIEESSELIERIKATLESIWTVEYVWFNNWKLKLKFPFRLWVDNSGEYNPMVLAPLEITIDFTDKNIRMSGYHPHNLWGSPCLWGELARLKDQCFRDRDIYGFVVGMAQFGNSFTSNDCGWQDRDPSKQLMYHLQGMSFHEVLAIKEVRFVDIFRTIAFYDVNRFVYNMPWFKEKCEDIEFLKPLLDSLTRDENKTRLLRALWYEYSEIDEFFKTNVLPSRQTEIVRWIHSDEWFFDDRDGDDYDDEEDWDEDEDE